MMGIFGLIAVILVIGCLELLKRKNLKWEERKSQHELEDFIWRSQQIKKVVDDFTNFEFFRDEILRSKLVYEYGGRWDNREDEKIYLLCEPKKDIDNSSLDASEYLTRGKNCLN